MADCRTSRAVSRRVFVKSGAAAMLSLGFAPSFLARTVEAASSRRRLLVAIFQRGAVDGLNMIVPFGEAEYYGLRRSIAIAKPGSPDGAIALDGFFGFHPRMAPLKPLWDNGSLAVIHASGSHDRTRSHFDAQDYMETATPGVKSTRDGWLNRYLSASATSGREATRPAALAGRSATADRLADKQGQERPASTEATAGKSPLRGIAVARQMPRTLQGRAPALAFSGVEAFAIRGGMDSQRAVREAYEGAANPLLSGAARDAFEAMETLRRTGAYQPAAGVQYPRSAFGQALQEIARVAKADVGLEVAFAESGNWDHHVNEGAAQGQLAQRLDDLSRGIAALVADLGDRMADTVILTMSEFGRAAAENGNGGTDHGHGNAMMVIGGPVKGRHVYGLWPGLGPDQRFEGRDLAVTTDFRDVFGEIVVSHLGLTTDALARVFPGHPAGPSLGLIRV